MKAKILNPILTMGYKVIPCVVKVNGVEASEIKPGDLITIEPAGGENEDE